MKISRNQILTLCALLAASALAQTPPAQTSTLHIGVGQPPLATTRSTMEQASAEMAQAALAFWASLTPELQAKCGFQFDSEERFNWHYIPRARKGITFNDMTPAQQALGHAFLASGLSSRGYRQAESIMSLDQILKEMADNAPVRDSANYAFSIFGTPGEHSTWGWRYEGHHVAINFTIVDGHAVTGPVFFGANPAQVLSGPRKGLAVLAVEENLGRELVKSLTPDQQKIAIYDAKSPNEIITSNSRKANPGPPIGLRYSDMTAPQKKLLMTLVQEFAYRLRPELADDDLQKIAAADPANISFGWAGSTEPGQGHYYRIHGPTFLIEFDNTQNSANHIHSVWRDAANDFGEDLLKQHYTADKTK